MTPHGTGHPMNLCPDTLMLPIGFLNVTLGACSKTKFYLLIRGLTMSRRLVDYIHELSIFRSTMSQ